MTTSSSSMSGRLSRDTASQLRGLLRSAWAVPVLGLVLWGAAVLLGGAVAFSVPLCATGALLALAFTGVDVRSLRRDRLFLAALVVLAVAAWQLLPLPPWLLRLLDRASAEMSAGALSPLQLDRASAWRPLHLDPGNGWNELHYLVGLTAAYLAARQCTLRGYGAALGTLVAVATASIAAVALMHKMLGLEALFGFYRPLQASPPILAPLLNPNHLAAFTGVGVVLWAGRTAEALNPTSRILNSTVAVVCGAVCALSLSRGGVAAALGGLVLFALLSAWPSAVGKDRAGTRGLQAALTVSVVVAAALYVAWSALAHEYGHRDTSKLSFLGPLLTLLREHPLFGVGSNGLYAAVGLRGLMPGGVTVLRAESLPVDLALAFGPVAALVVLALSARWLWNVRPSRRTSRPSEMALFCALVSLVLHDLVDFALWLGATGYLAALLAGVLSGQLEIERSASPVRARGRWRRSLAVLAIVSALAGTITARSALYLDREQMLAAVGNEMLPDAVLARMLSRHPGDAFLPYAAAAEAVRAHDPRAFRFVSRAMTLAPAYPQPHALLAQVLAARGLRSQAMVEIRYAAATGAASLSSLAELLASLAPSDDEIVRTLPPGDIGVALLRALATGREQTDLGARVDAILLARVPDDLAALGREASRAHEQHDDARERALFERIMRIAPRDPAGYLGLAGWQMAHDDLPGAEATLRMGMVRSREGAPLLRRLASVQASKRDVQGMRQTMQQVLDLVGANIEQRVLALAHLGDLEAQLGNDAAALAAFERADSMSLPEQPYLHRVIQLAQRLNDMPRVRGACISLTERGEMTPYLRQVCAEADRQAGYSLPAGL